MELERKAGWAASTLHSEYFDLLLGVGCIGAITYVFIILSGLRRTLLLYKLHRSKYYAMECAIVVFFLATMLLENPGRDPNVLTFVFFTIMAKRGLLREPELHTSQLPAWTGRTAANSLQVLLAVKGNLK
jgi:O-antigen ligase